MSRSNDWSEYDRDPSARKARKSVERKHKSARRHDEKQQLKDYMNDLNARGKDFNYDEYEDNDE
jgi:hypothetical protein